MDPESQGSSFGPSIGDLDVQVPISSLYPLTHPAALL